MQPPLPTPRPTPGRALAPDLARGLMLLFIAVANVPWHLWGHPLGVIGGHQQPSTLADKVCQVFMIVFVDGHIFPMFAFLFGYGMVQFYRSRRLAGLSDKDVRRMLLRRHWAMLAFGALHALLLFSGDILGGYAIAAMVFGVVLFRRRDVVVWVVSSILFGLGVLLTVTTLVGGMLAGPEDDPLTGAEGVLASAAEPNYLRSALMRIDAWYSNSLWSALFIAVPLMIMLGWLGARHRLLEDVARHRRRLWLIACLTLPIAWAGGAVQAIQQLGGLTSLPGWSMGGWVIGVGPIAGPGYVALFALLADHFRERRPAWLLAVAAVGQRSLSCYLFQSIVFAPVLCRWGLGLGGHLTTWSSMLFAAVVWALSVVLADQLRRRGNRRGPFEVVLRRLTYGSIPGRALPASGPVRMPWEPPPMMLPGWPVGWQPAPPPLPETIPTPARPRD